jgi:alpha-mannosidase
MPDSHLVVVPHTHWDREWYRTHESFRYRLVRFLDRLLDTLDADPSFRHFTLDGQTIAVDDYLAMRPEQLERIARLVREGRLLVGPWTVLPDEWLVSGEALLRNLRLGLCRAAELGGAMPIGYVPDQFGHVGQLPQIFAGMGFSSAIVWRGVGADVPRTPFLWEAPDGTRLLTIYLVHGYGNGQHLPREPRALAERLSAELRSQEPLSDVSSVLVMAGGDHAEPSPALPAALAAAAGHLGPVRVEIGTLPGFVERVRREAPADLAIHRGELRSGLRAPLLQGCASTRMPQKRADFHNDRLLTRYAEPLSAWLEALGGDGDPGILSHAWRIALENHPHDSICGCSVDAVHDQMDSRFARVRELVEAHLSRVGRELAERVACPDDEGGTPLVVWNPNAGGRAEADGVVELAFDESSEPLALHARDAEGRTLPVHAEIAVPGHVYACYALPAATVAVMLRGFPEEFFGDPVCSAQRRRDGGREVLDVWLGDAPSTGFDWPAEREALARQLEAQGDAQVLFRPRRRPRVRVRFVDEHPGAGLRRYTLREGRVDSEYASLRAERDASGGALLDNGTWRIEASAAGRVRCTHQERGVVLEDALRVVSEGDRGDTYTGDPLLPRVEELDRVEVSLTPATTARVGLAIDACLRVPACLLPDRGQRSTELVDLPLRIEVALSAGLDRVEVDLRADNAARDHRLRLHVRAPFEARRFEVESAFEVASRPVAPAPDAFGSEHPAELPTGATPQRTFATLIGDAAALTVANRGCAEVEAVPESAGCTSLALTLLRAVGWLSRDDLRMRPVHAGPPLATPGAQVPGPHRLELSFRLHAPEDAQRIPAAHAFAVPPLVLEGGGGPGAPLADGARIVEVDDPEVVLSAIEPRTGRSPLIRLYNASPRQRRFTVRWNGSSEALREVDLIGQPRSDAGASSAPSLSLRPWQIVCFEPERAGREGQRAERAGR